MIPNQPIGQPVEHPQATMILFLGALSILCCGIAGPVAWALGRRALDQIEESGGAFGGRAQVLVGYVLGVIGTIFMVIMATLFILVTLTGNA